MKFRPARWLSLICVGLAAFFLVGCGPLLDRELEDDKDPNFIDGRNKAQALDYTGAIESFEKALLANPKNAAAHFELGILYEQQMRKYSAAVYHYEKFLELKPKSGKNSIIREHINAAIQEQAKTVAFVVIPNDVQKHIDTLNRTNALLRTNIDQLRAVLATRPQYVTNWFTNTIYLTNYVAVRQPFQAQPAPMTRALSNSAPRLAATPAPTTRHDTPTVQAPKPTTRVVAPAAPTSHRVQAGETFGAIARRHGISVNTLRSLNPSVSPTSLRPGQELRLPAKAPSTR